MFSRQPGARKAFVLATLLALLPIALILLTTLTGQLLRENGTTIFAQRKTKAFYLCQSGLAAAQRLFCWNAYRGHTHESDGTTITNPASADFLSIFDFPDHSWDSSNGTYRWSWNSSKPLSKSFTRTGGSESYSFKVYMPTPNTYAIECEAEVDGQISRQRVGGTVENPFGYTTFDNGDCNDYTLAEDVSIKGKLHANGDLFVRPWQTVGLNIDLHNIPVIGSISLPLVKPSNANYNFDVDAMTSGAKIYRHRDLHGQPDVGGSLMISSSGLGLASTAMPGGTQGVAFDSDNPNWRPGQTPANQPDALTRYKGAVLDKELGAKRQDISFLRAFESGGYYDDRAQLHIKSNSNYGWMSNKTFYNQNENRQVTVKEIDVAQMVNSGNFPANGIIHSDVPVRLTNGQNISKKFTLASTATIYTKGDFNVDDPNGNGSAQSVALMTTDRVYHLTSSFSDAKSNVYPYPDPVATQALIDSQGLAALPALQAALPLLAPATDSDSVLEVNAAIVDGAPADDILPWNPKSALNTGQNIYRSDGTNTGVRHLSVPSDPAHIHFAYPTGGDYLENLQGLTIKSKGPRVHMQTAKMAAMDNANLAANPNLTPWIYQTCFLPADKRVFEADPKLALPNTEPPGSFRACRQLFWKVL